MDYLKGVCPKRAQNRVHRQGAWARVPKLSWGDQAGLEQCRLVPMGPRLIVSDNREDHGNPLILDGQAIDEAARDPVAIGKLMVDQAWAEGIDPTGGGLYYERNSNQHRRLQAFETGSEDFMTGGWVRVLATAEQVRKERPGMERAAKAGLVRIHGTHRGVLLVEFLDVPWG